MSITEEKRTVQTPHNVILEDRKRLTVTGVSDVDSFDEQTIVVYTGMGELTLRGNGLHISRLNTETGELNVTGTVYAMAYTDERSKGDGMFSRLFK